MAEFQVKTEHVRSENFIDSHNGQDSIPYYVSSTQNNVKTHFRHSFIQVTIPTYSCFRPVRIYHVNAFLLEGLGQSWSPTTERRLFLLSVVSSSIMSMYGWPVLLRYWMKMNLWWSTEISEITRHSIDSVRMTWHIQLDRSMKLRDVVNNQAPQGKRGTYDGQRMMW